MYTSDDTFYVGDLDRYIAIPGAGEREDYDIDDFDLDQFGNLINPLAEAKLESEKAKWGDLWGTIPLLNGVSTSGMDISKIVTVEEWRWARYQAERKIQQHLKARLAESAFLKAILSFGRPYAIRRYAKLERIPLQDAKVASLKRGIEPVIIRLLYNHSITPSYNMTTSIFEFFDQEEMQILSRTSYERTADFQRILHKIIATTRFAEDPTMISLSELARSILSLVRLHFSVAETHLENFDNLEHMLDLYNKVRLTPDSKTKIFLPSGKRYIKNWRLRHLHSLIFYYPKGLRAALTRGLRCRGGSYPRPADACELYLNELALAYCCGTPRWQPEYGGRAW